MVNGTRDRKHKGPLARNASGTALGLLADRVLGEPPERLHPLPLFGKLANGLEKHVYGDSRARGVVHCALGTTIGIASGSALRAVPVATYLSSGARELWDVATKVEAALERGRIDEARILLPSLVGRDTADLDEKEITRAVIESVAENTVDALVAPALWATVAGAPGALGYRAINTLDAMVGHRSERYSRFGWAAARTDDAAGWLPARLTALVVGLVRPRSAVEVLRAVVSQAPAHPSPNAGVAEASFSAALGLRLGGENRYGDRTEIRPMLGTGRAPEPADITRCVALSRDVGDALVVMLCAVSVVAGRRHWRARHRGSA